jgi:hypothetical protein
MKDASQQQTDPRSSGGFYPVIPPHLIRAAGNSAVAIAAAGLGLLAAVALAITGCDTGAAPAPPKPAAPEPVAQSAQPPAPSAPPVPNPAPAPVPVIAPDTKKETSAAPKPSHAAHKVSAAKPAEAYFQPVQQTPRRQLYLNKFDVDPASGKRAPYAPKTPHEATSNVTTELISGPMNGQTALQLATAAAAAGPFVLCIEGDVTVAGYDAATSTIETFERQTYVLNSAPGASGAISWDDFPFNIHYRCDGSGNCTLYHGSAFAEAKLVR